MGFCRHSVSDGREGKKGKEQTDTGGAFKLG